MTEKRPKLKRGRKPWIKDPKEDGGKDLAEKIEKIRSLAQFTDIDREIAAALGISHETWYSTIRKYPEISDAQNDAWQSTLLKVKASLLKKALNGDFNAQKLFLERKAGWREESKIEHNGLPASVPQVIIQLPDNGRQVL